MTTTVKFLNQTPCVAGYLADIRNFENLSPEEEINCAIKAKKGDIDARNTLINSYQKWIYSQAKKYAKTDDEVTDYVSEGTIGFIEALDNFDETKGFKFITFARFYVQRAMNYYLENTINPIKRTNHLKFGKKIYRIKEEYYAENGFFPNADEIMEILKEKYGLNAKSVEDVMDVDIQSINEERDDSDSQTYGESDLLYNQKTAEYNEYNETAENDYIKESVNELLSNLSERDSDIFKMSFGIDYERQYNMEEIAFKYNISEQQIKKIIKKGISKMREIDYHKIAI